MAIYFDYSSRAALLANKNCSVANLNDAEFFITHQLLLVVQRLKTSKNLSSGLTSIDIFCAAIYKTITLIEKLSKKIWANINEMAIASAEDRVFHTEKMERMMEFDGLHQRELDCLIQVNIKTRETDVLLTVTYDYFAKA